MKYLLDLFKGEGKCNVNRVFLFVHEIKNFIQIVKKHYGMDPKMPDSHVIEHVKSILFDESHHNAYIL